MEFILFKRNLKKIIKMEIKNRKKNKNNKNKEEKCEEERE